MKHKYVIKFRGKIYILNMYNIILNINNNNVVNNIK